VRADPHLQPHARPPFAVSIEPLPEGWLVVITLGEGASMSKWFEAKEDALRYPEELADWLKRGRE
jgi:hypothetical protein